MGYARGSSDAEHGLRFYDPQTLKRVSYSEPDNLWGSHPQYCDHPRLCRHGVHRVGASISPNGIRLLTLEVQIPRSQHASAGYLIPSADGSLVLTSSGVYSRSW